MRMLSIIVTTKFIEVLFIPIEILKEVKNVFKSIYKNIKPIDFKKLLFFILSPTSFYHIMLFFALKIYRGML